MSATSFLMTTNRSILLVLMILLGSAFPASAQPGNQVSDDIDRLMNHCHDNRMFNGVVLVARGDSVIFEKPYGYAVMEWEVPHTLESKFRLASNTKQFTAALILMLVERGEIKLDEPITQYLPHFDNRLVDSVTVHQLLTHTSGVPQKSAIHEEHPEFWVTEYSLEEYLDLFEDKPLEFQPGTRFEYRSIGYQMLASIIEQTTGMSYEDALNEFILEPLNMNDSGFNDVYQLKRNYAFAYENWEYRYNVSEYYSPTHGVGGIGVYSTAHDLHRWNRAIDDHTLISQSLTQRMFTADPATQRHFEGYGYGWYIGEYDFEENNQKVRYQQHSGGMPGHTSLITRLPDHGYYVVLLNNTGHAMLELISYEIIRVLFGFEWKMPKDLAVTLDRCTTPNEIDCVKADYHANDDTYTISEGALSGLCYEKTKAGDTELGKAVYDFGMELFPGSIRLEFGMAEALYRSGQYSEAAAYYRKVLEARPDYVRAKQRIALIARKITDVPDRRD